MAEILLPTGSARTYTTLAAAIAAIPTSIGAWTSGDDYVVELYNDSQFSLSPMTLSGHPTSATRRIIFRPAPGHSFYNHAGRLSNALRYDQSKGVGISLLGADITAGWTIDDNFVFMDGLQFTDASANVGTAELILWNGNSGRLSNSIAENRFAQGTRSSVDFSDACTSGAVNSLIICQTANAGRNGGWGCRGTGAMINCGALRTATIGSGTAYSRNYGTPLIRGCWAFGFQKFGRDTTADAGSGYNATDLAAANTPGSNNQYSLTASSHLVSTTAGSEDCRLQSGSALNTQGVRDQTYTADLDILKSARSTSTPSIGPYEYVAAPAPILTGPSGAAGAGSSTANLAEVATTGPTFTTSTTLGGGYPSLTGADAASFGITALSATSWRVDPVTPFNFESLPHSNPFNVTFNASASVSQTCAITITNVNEAPGFSGTISVPGLTESVVMSAINAALLFSDPDSGDTGTYSAVGTFPTGVTVSSGGLISGTPGAGTAATYSSLRVRRTDGGGLTADSNVFSITVSASGAPPGVTTQPSDQTVTEGGVATFTAAFSNSPTGFAWEFADAPYSSWSPVVGGSGAATASYTTGALLLANNARRFRCTGTNAFGSTTTNGAAQVTVNAASGLAGFDFHSTVGCRFGAIAGSLVGLAPEVGVSIVIRVYNASTGALVATLPAAVTNSSGYLPRATHASLVAATSYTLNAVWPDGAVYAFNLVAT